MAKIIRPIPGISIVSGALFVMGIGAAVAKLPSANLETLSVGGLSFAGLVPGFEEILSISPLPYATLAFLTLKMSFVLALVTVITARALNTKADYTKELRNQGIANIGISVIGGVPVTIGFIRTKLLEKAGAASPLAGMFLGINVVIIVVFFDFLLQMIPTAVFIGILIKAGLSSLDLQAWKDYRADKSHLITFLFVTIGSILIVIFDIVTVFLGSVILWSLLNRMPSARKHCKDIKTCPCLG